MHIEAAERFEHQHRYLDAALAYRDGGRVSHALRAVVRVPSSDPRYLAAVKLAVEMATKLQVVSHELEQFVVPLLRTPPRSSLEAAVVLGLAQLYEATQYLQQAIALFRNVLVFSPAHPVALEGLLRAQTAADRTATREVLVQPGELRAVRSMLRAEGNHSSDGFSIPLPEVLAGRYKIEGLLGRGAFASVYRALDLELNESVALKLMRSFGPDGGATARFRREVSLARNLGHPNIVRIYDLAQDEDLHFFTMELIEGLDLGKYLERYEVSLEQGRAFLLQALDALSFAHGQRVVHRDIKPENMFVSTSGELKLADFGLAKGPASPALTLNGIAGGTPDYMSPEQINDLRSADHRSDLYSLGAVAYELFTGQLPFEAEALTSLLLMHLEKTPRPLRALKPDLPKELDVFVLKLLAKRREDRFQTAAEARHALGRMRL